MKAAHRFAVGACQRPRCSTDQYFGSSLVMIGSLAVPGVGRWRVGLDLKD